MSKRELIVEQLERLPEQDLDRLLSFMEALTKTSSNDEVSTLAAESALAKDWLSPDEEAAWADLQVFQHC